METSKENLEFKGVFFESLSRNNSKIRKDRAVSIAEDAEMIYRREIEDMIVELKKLRRERENMLDLSPTTTDSLILASDFNSKDFVKRDLDLAVRIRNLEIKLELAEDRFKYLFT